MGVLSLPAHAAAVKKMSYARMARRFNKVYARARRPGQLIPADFAKEAFVIFSDQHKGDGSGADDFRDNAALYLRALSFYKEKGYKLVVLGDSEECWENSFGAILSRYGDVIRTEVAMAVATPQGKKLRLWGNHDKEVSLRRFKRYYRKLGTGLLDSVTYREGLCLGRDIFLVHGHQGRFFEDIAWRVSRLAVKFVWKSLQKLFLIGKEGPSENIRLRQDLELNYYRWAKKKRLLLICGHTHRALFASLTHLDRLDREILELEQKQEALPAAGRQETTKVISEKKGERAETVQGYQGVPRLFFEPASKEPVPCYFNSGCCLYANGVTCLEIEKDWIRLIKWQQGTAERQILAEGDLEKILAAVKRGLPLSNKAG
jgi:predicted phosphodiesterase